MIITTGMLHRLGAFNPRLIIPAWAAVTMAGMSLSGHVQRLTSDRRVSRKADRRVGRTASSGVCCCADKLQLITCAGVLSDYYIVPTPDVMIPAVLLISGTCYTLVPYVNATQQVTSWTSLATCADGGCVVCQEVICSCNFNTASTMDIDFGEGTAFGSGWTVSGTGLFSRPCTGIWQGQGTYTDYDSSGNPTDQYTGLITVVANPYTYTPTPAVGGGGSCLIGFSAEIVFLDNTQVRTCVIMAANGQCYNADGTNFTEPNSGGGLGICFGTVVVTPS